MYQMVLSSYVEPSTLEAIEPNCIFGEETKNLHLFKLVSLLYY